MPSPLCKLSMRAICGAIGMMFAAQASAEGSFTEALTSGKTSMNLRYRFEDVDQNNALKNAKASTLRLRLGYETGEFNGFGAFVEAETLTTIGDDDYNSTINGKTSYSTVADPKATEINQAYLSLYGIPSTKLKYGRQRIMLDNHRFIGNVGWRQNEQTFDAFTASNESLPQTTVTAGYIYNVDRVFSDRSPVGNFNMKSPIFNVRYKGFRFGEVVGYGYLLDFADLPASSTQTYGLRFKGSTPLNSDIKALYTAEYATQHDYKNNPGSFSMKYYLLEGGVAVAGAEVKLGQEVLGSTGTVSFQTPLATLHAMNGWADIFLVTPAAGLKDSYASAGTTVFGVKVDAIYHDFRADRNGTRYGTEVDLQAVKNIGKIYAVGAKYAAYNAKGLSVDTDKFWLWAEAKF